LLAALVLLYPLGDRYWLSTLLLVGPRFVLGLPLPLLALAALALDRRLLWGLGLLALVLLGPVMGFELPLRLPARPSSTPRDIRVLTWNVGGGRLTPEELRSVLEEHLPTIAVLQECGGRVLAPGAAAEWTEVHESGLCLLSRLPVQRVAARPLKDVWMMGGSAAIVRYEIETIEGPLHLTNVHLETPRKGIQAVLLLLWRGIRLLEAENRQRDFEARLAREWVDASPGPSRLVAGDFNMTVESAVFREHWAGYEDAFSSAGFGFGFTKRTRRFGTRIDHILLGPGWVCLRTWVGAHGHDHFPVLADLRFVE
jgi:endonuclease/exonuclease/phosphatase (EEP) superfamily protein YafD